MEAGKLRHRVTIEAPDDEQDASGQVNPDDQWTTSQTRYAAVEPLSGRNLEIARQIAAEITHKFTFRFFALGLSKRLVHDSRKFEILYAHDLDEKKRYLIVYAVERMPA